MSKRSNKCHGVGSGGIHKYKRYTTTKGKPIWRCVDCSSGFNYMPAMIGSSARCHDCSRVYPLVQMVLEGENAPLMGVGVVCKEADCAVYLQRTEKDKRIMALAQKYAAAAIESSSDSEQEDDDPFLAKLRSEAK